MKSFVVWNPHIVNSFGVKNVEYDPDTYDGLLIAESDGCSVSTHIITHDIESVVQLAANECNIELKYAEVAVDRIAVAIFSLGDYSKYDDAESCRAVTYLDPVFEAELPLIKSTFSKTCQSIGNNDRVIGTVIEGVFKEL
jgi:hypothetical protein